MSLTNEQIQSKLQEKFGDQVTNFSEPYGMLTFEAPNELNLKVLQFLFDDEVLKGLIDKDIDTDNDEILHVNLMHTYYTLGFPSNYEY